MASIAKVPANLPITVTVGADFALALTVTLGGVAYDFNGATVSAVILDSTGTVQATAFTTSVASNVLTLTLTDTNTTTLGQGVFSYAVTVTKGGSTDPWLAGTLSLVPAGRGGISSASTTLSITTAPTATVTIAGGVQGATGATGAQGIQGVPGDAATITVGSVSTGTPSAVTNVGTSSAAIFDFVLEKGDKGDKGDTGNTGSTGAAGAAATIAAGTTSTLSAGASATVTNSGTSSAAVFDFGIPQGAKGDKGDTGNTGATGAAGAAGQWDSAQSTATKSDSYTLLTADAGKLILMDKGTAQNVTVDGSLDLTTGQRIDVIQTGAGQVTFVASSATVNGTPGLKLRARYSAATVICVGTDSYVVVGDLSA